MIFIRTFNFRIIVFSFEFRSFFWLLFRSKNRRLNFSTSTEYNNCRSYLFHFIFLREKQSLTNPRDLLSLIFSAPRLYLLILVLRILLAHHVQMLQSSNETLFPFSKMQRAAKGGKVTNTDSLNILGTRKNYYDKHSKFEELTE